MPAVGTPRPVLWPGRLLRRLREAVPVAMWIAAVAGVLWLAARDRAGLQATGFVRTVTRGVAPLTAGNLKLLAVETGQRVEAGEILAALDSADVDLGLAAAEAELARLEAELGKRSYELTLDQTMQQAEYRSDLRRFLTDRDEAHIEVLKTHAAIERDQVRLQGVELELQRLRAMDPAMVSMAELEELEIEERELQTRLAERRKLLAQQQRFYEAARDRAERFLEDHGTGEVDPLLRPLEWAIAAQKVRLEEISLARTRLTLKAPVSGRVAVVHRRPGEVVGAGEPVLTLVETTTPEVVAYLPEAVARTVVPGTGARVRPLSGGGAFDAVVLRTGAMVEPVPERIDPTLSVPRFGVPVFLSSSPEQGLLPGERCAVTFQAGQRAPAEAAASPR